jgi:hypothetical protein
VRNMPLRVRAPNWVSVRACCAMPTISAENTHDCHCASPENITACHFTCPSNSSDYTSRSAKISGAIQGTAREFSWSGRR